MAKVYVSLWFIKKICFIVIAIFLIGIEGGNWINKRMYECNLVCHLIGFFCRYNLQIYRVSKLDSVIQFFVFQINWWHCADILGCVSWSTIANYINTIDKIIFKICKTNQKLVCKIPYHLLFVNYYQNVISN